LEKRFPPQLPKLENFGKAKGEPKFEPFEEIRLEKVPRGI